MTKNTEAFSSPADLPNKYDCIVVGAGHNGLATALVLATEDGRRRIPAGVFANEAMTIVDVDPQHG